MNECSINKFLQKLQTSYKLFFYCLITMTYEVEIIEWE